MAELRNRAPQDPWSVRLTSAPADAEGWRAGRLTLRRGGDPEPLVELDANLYGEELPGLAQALADVADGALTDLTWEPLEPSFLLRAHHWSPDEIELSWFADQGELTAKVSTDSGVGVMIRVDSRDLAAFAETLASEGNA